jgi:hypothetical protein
MEEKVNQTAGGVRVQVFELTMDNTEDQDELNRRLQKPGERDRSSPARNVRTEQGESAAESAGK